jgi:hypothetical protein
MPSHKVDSTYVLVDADKYVPADRKYHRIMASRTPGWMIK